MDANPTNGQIQLARTITELNTSMVDAYVHIARPLVDAFNQDMANFGEAMRIAGSRQANRRL